ncbi:MAG: TolC family protein [Vicinamibacterales bacterium]
MRHIPTSFLLVIAIASGAGAQTTAAPTPLTLEDALERGVAASLRLREADAQADAATAVVAQREASSRPQIAAQAGYTRTNHVDEFGVPTPNGQLRIIYPDVPDNYRTRLDLQWPIYTGGRQSALERAAATEATAAGALRDAVAEDLRFEIALAYWTFVTSLEEVRTTEAALERTTSYLAEVRNQLDAGVAAPNDVLTVEAQQARERTLVIRSVAHRDSAEADLARLVGLQAGARIAPLSRLTDMRPPNPEAFEVLTAEARAQRADRAAMVERVEAARARRAAAAAGMRPTVAVGGGVDYAQPNPRIFPRQEEWRSSWDASVNVAWPLSDGGRTRAEVAEADALVRASEARLDEFDRVLAVEIGHRLRDITASRAAVEASETGVRAATEARRVAGDRFAAGVATNTDVLVAQSALLQAELDRAEALAAARVADARLDRVLGR